MNASNKLVCALLVTTVTVPGSNYFDLLNKKQYDNIQWVLDASVWVVHRMYLLLVVALRWSVFNEISCDKRITDGYVRIPLDSGK